MDNFENNQNMDLYFQDIKLLFSNLEDLKNNLKRIIELKQKNKDISNTIKTIENILLLIKPFVNNNNIITSEKLETSKESLKSVVYKLKNYFNSNEEMNNLHEINRLINSSKEILNNYEFNPQSENLNEDFINNNLSSTNSFSTEESPFLIDENSKEKEEYVENEFSLLQGNKLNKKNENKISLKENSKKFIDNCREAINLAVLNFSRIDGPKEYENFPFPSYFMAKSQYLDWILNLEYNLKHPYNHSLEESAGSLEEGLNNYNNIENRNQNTDEDFVDESYELGNEVPSPNYEINKSFFYFINIISKEYIKLKKENLKQLSDNISKCLRINNSNLFLIQNSPIDNFVKSLNFKEMTLNLNDNYQPISKLQELKSIKYNLLIKEYEIKEFCFDNRGNFIYPNSRRKGYRGKEPYIPPYDWIGLGLNVLGKYEDDNWLEDIRKESEWTVAYRGIALKIQKNIKIKLKEFIVKGNLKSANVILKKVLNDSRHWKVIKSGIYMTPYIKIAEKYTQSISYNNKNYKVLLMAKVKISEIQQPKGSSFWLLNDEHIRIYRVLFKEIN